MSNLYPIVMKRVKWFTATIAMIATIALLAASCTGEDPVDGDINYDTFTAGFSDARNQTLIEQGLNLHWHEMDQISIFRSTLNEQYQFKGQTGDDSGTFKRMSTESGAQGASLAAIYALYPYSQNASIGIDGTITMELPAVQEYAENSLGKGANSMVAVTAGKEDLFFPFKNLCGYLKIKVYGENVNIRSIELKGNNGEVLSGKATVTAKYQADPQMSLSPEGGKSITLNCNASGVNIGNSAGTATEFWFVIPPVTFTKGFTLTIADANGNKTTQSTSKTLTVERNTIEAFDVMFVADNWENQIIYTTSDNTAITIDESFFDATILSHSYDKAGGKGRIIFNKRLTTIKEGAFRSRTTLTGITIPEGVTTLGYSLFAECSRLEEVTLPGTLKAIPGYMIQGCSNLKTFVIPDGVTSIENCAFSGGTSLTDITIPESVTTIGASAFYGCRKLAGITIPEGVTAIGGSTFYGCSSLASITIPESVTSIGGSAFYDCSSLTSINIPENVTSIGISAFKSCLSLASVNIPEGVTSIESSTFYDCSRLASIDIPEGVTSIGESAFWYCSSLTEITIPKGVTSIGYSTFYHCRKLASINIPESVTSIGSNAFSYCNSLTNITIPEGVTKIASYAFMSCWSLTSITIPEGVTSIGEMAFSYCISLKNITIPESVTGIGEWAFYSCNSLTGITIPKRVTNIGDSAFYMCTKLSEVCSESTTPATLGSMAFSSPIAVLKVPKGCVSAYQSSGWAQYFSSIEEME